MASILIERSRQINLLGHYIGCVRISKEKKMSRFPSFLEYLNDKGTVVEKPEVEQVPDYHGPDDKTPPNSKVPYKTPTTPKAAQKGEKGLGELGDGKLKYEPDTGIKYDVKKDIMKESMNAKATTAVVADYKGPKADAPKGGKPYVAKSIKAGEKALGDVGDQSLKYEPDTDTSKPIKPTKTESFINKTKGMSLSEFTKYMLEECGCGQVSGDDLPYVTAYTTGKFQPHPPEVIRYISTLADKNQGVLENLVSTVVSMGYLNKLMKAIFEHPQAYEELTALLGDEEEGPSRCKSFAGAMGNSYSKFLSDQEGLYESVSGPLGFDDSEEEDEDDERHHDDEESEEEDFDSEEEFGDEEDSEDMEDDQDGEDMDDDHEGEEDFDPESSGNDHDMDEPEHRERKLKKKFAHHHLLDAMKGHEAMMKAMRGC